MKILYGIIALVVVAGGAWYVMQGTAEAPSQEMASESRTDGATAHESQIFSGSMQDLMTRSGSWQCDVSVTAEGITTSGTTYVSGGKIRADFTSNVPQVGNIESHMIMRDNTAYTWSNMMNRGFKFPIKGNEVEPEVSAEMAAQVNQNYDYNCKAWSADENKFALPTGITF